MAGRPATIGHDNHGRILAVGVVFRVAYSRWTVESSGWFRRRVSEGVAGLGAAGRAAQPSLEAIEGGSGELFVSEGCALSAVYRGGWLDEGEVIVGLVVACVVVGVIVLTVFERWEQRRQARIVEAARRQGRRVMFR